jgi:hypothetical protein
MTEEADLGELYAARAAELGAKSKEDVLALNYVWVMPAAPDEPSSLVSIPPDAPDAALIASAVPGAPLGRVHPSVFRSLRIYAATAGDLPKSSAGDFVLDALGVSHAEEIRGPVVVTAVQRGLSAEEIVALDNAHTWGLYYMDHSVPGYPYAGNVVCSNSFTQLFQEDVAFYFDND